MNTLKTCSYSHQLAVPCICHNIFGSRAFALADPRVSPSSLHHSAAGLDHFQGDLTVCLLYKLHLLFTTILMAFSW